MVFNRFISLESFCRESRFPNLRLAYKLNDHNKLSIFYNRRVDRPNEVDIRIFPKYDDAEIIKVGNPGLRPQFTNSIELGHKYNWNNGYLYSALYHRFANGTIIRISSIVPESTLIYAVFQNAGRSYNSGLDMIWNQKVSKIYSFNINGNIYRNQIDAFSVENLYPQPVFFSADEQTAVSGNVKFNNTFRFSNGFDAQLTAIYLAPDIIPQGKIKSRFSIDLGMKKSVQNGKGEIFLNATDLLNTMVIKKQIQGSGFKYTSDDYYETQVIRLGYSYKF
ncbi:outer membrane beta-barrel family protein [Elizabethkingia anophelis]|uniref:outer membrane beta-barrel family protein n=1 Tax=Elizabethkingia anophelis TaxID=1117645 RepID=UPI0021A435F6|nr:TonB-dependent receptor [Elizabethkingia anophelis]